MMIKNYDYKTYDSIYDATNHMTKHQEWNIISVYPTGFRQEVCVVYYIKNEQKQW